MVLWLTVLAFAKADAQEHHRALPRIRVDTARRCFVTEDGRVFTPFGVNYFRPGTGWAPQVWKRFDASATREDFRKMKEWGINCVRVFLTFDSFYREKGELEQFGLQRWEQFLKIAEDFGIYVHPTGPDHWEGLPAWARRDRIADTEILDALVDFWKLFAARNRGRSVIFAYDLLNEPSVPWDTTALRQRWRTFLQTKYGMAEKLIEAWGIRPDSLNWEDPPVPTETSPKQAWVDYQTLREEVADEWTRRQTEAIKSADPEALVTVGLIQWSVPVLLPDRRTYSAFRPDRLARFVDFLEIHFYPLARGFYEYQREDDLLANLAYLESIVREVAKTGKPVVIAEFGWYGGGRLTINEGRHPPATEEQQADWCTAVIRTTQGLACGWLNWGLYDHPEARDVTQLTGLFRADGTPKVWAHRFRTLAQKLGSYVPSPLANWDLRDPRPTLDWSRAVSEPDYPAAFRRVYLEQFLESRAENLPSPWK